MHTNLIIKIKNAQAVGHKTLKTAYNRLDKAIADILESRGFISSAEVKGRPLKRSIAIGLEAKRKIEAVKFLSRSSARRYFGWRDIKPIKSGFGLLVISTSKGVMTGEEAKSKKLGGEPFFEVW